jgi:hypothetical protein
MESVTAEAACTALLPPKLREFIWDFPDPERETWDAFSKKQTNWILEFAECAINRRAKLKTIKIVFNPPTYWDEERIGDQLRFWPWDLMDQVKNAVSADIDVVYNDRISKRECKTLADTFMRLV